MTQLLRADFRETLRRLGLIGLVALVLAGLGAPVAAQQSAACNAPLRIGVSQLGVAYFKRADGQAQGYDLDLVRELARRLGCTFEIVDMNRVRIFQSLEHGEFIDVATSASQTPERDKYGQFVPLSLPRNYLLVHKKLATAGFDLNQFTATPMLRMGMLAGSNYGPFINARLAVLARQDRIETTPQVEMLIPRLIAARYDGLIVTPAYYIAALRELHGGEDIAVLPIPESEAYLSGFYLSLKTLTEVRRHSIQQTLRAMQMDGSVLRIYRQYFPEAQARERAAVEAFGK